MPKNTPETAPEQQQQVEMALTPTQVEKAHVAPSGAPEKAITLTDEEKQRIRNMAAASTGRKFGLSRRPDGSIVVDVTLPVELAGALESQAECVGESLEAFIQRTVVEALEAYYGSTAA